MLKSEWFNIIDDVGSNKCLMQLYL